MSKQTDNKQFWQRWASCYGPLMQSSEPLYAAIAQQMQPHLTPEMNVLELACGSGQLSFRLSRLVRDWEATDFSPKMIAQAKLKPRGAGLHFSVQDATSLPYADETFDAVLIANALHIMPRPEKALAEIYRVLKPGGQNTCRQFSGRRFRRHGRLCRAGTCPAGGYPGPAVLCPRCAGQNARGTALKQSTSEQDDIIKG